jgi:hypothetical protein
MKWFRHVFDNIGGSPPIIQCGIDYLNNTIHLKISFDLRTVSLPAFIGTPTPMLSIVEWGSASPVKMTFERTVVQKCLEQLSPNGYFLPSYSYFLINALEEGESVTTTAKRLCRLNQNDMIWSIEISLSIFKFN